MAFKTNLQILRKNHNMTQTELAKSLSLSVETIRCYEQGKREPSFTILRDIKDFFNCTYDDLLN